MKLKRYYRLSMLSGCVWGVIALCLSLGGFGWLIIGGIAAAPLIGLSVGYIYRPAYGFPKSVKVLASLITLYLAAALFGLSVGIFDIFWGDNTNRIISAVILQGMWATLWGVTFTGYILLLWPLSFFNQWLLGSFALLSDGGAHQTPIHEAAHAR